MKYAVIAARVLLGLIFVVFGLNFFFMFIPMPPPPEVETAATRFGGALFGSGYMHAVKVFEIVGGALLLSGYYVPLGLVLLGPVIVNIALFHVFLDKSGYAMTAALLGLEGFLVYAYRASFAPLFQAKPAVG
ncbi:MAG TPA: DoxX family membrane protein [Candidatus Nanopelagicales bacterium]|nr:DoxX family membrane protein [Candidatus Nanopelagicales bacterium]